MYTYLWVVHRRFKLNFVARKTAKERKVLSGDNPNAHTRIYISPRRGQHPSRQHSGPHVNRESSQKHSERSEPTQESLIFYAFYVRRLELGENHKENHF